ncbi:SPOR domain-containing protein [Neolewinella antarctica]|uniref:SPOR domain-containing protein n=1 Tax=Neolewinella antarctica TaxID=442734 RepID=A0ABX0XE76_9BACT|nr:SPOR domain-containing protein [Neolewinella antarctica]NJC27585.1 hypothetical protein [Neolewinella antarctica]
MRNTPIIIPIILAVCLGTLAYLLYAALSDGADPTLPRAAVTTSKTAVPREYDVQEKAASDRYYEPALEEEEAKPNTYAESSEPLYAPDEDIANDYAGNQVARELEADLHGEYSILAGSFRQLINAQGQVKKLKAAGFTESDVIKSHGGAYALALVGRRANEREADELITQLKSKGFEAIMVKRN